MLKLYSHDTTVFTNNGLGVLKDATNCFVDEELNGGNLLTLEYPQNGFLNDDLITGNIVKAPCGHISGNDQLFRIKSMSNTLTRKNNTADHIFYDLAGKMIESANIENQSGNNALASILNATTEEHSFTSLSDIVGLNSTQYSNKNVVDTLIGADNCFVKTWGGELLRDNFAVKILNARGQDRGVKIRYGKNVKGIKWDIDDRAIYTRIYPVGYNGLTIPEKYIDSPLRGNYPNGLEKSREYKFSNIKIDLSNGINEATAQQQLRDAVQTLFDNGIDKPIVSIDVDFVELSKVKEYYEKYSAFESIYLGDTVQAIIPYMNLNLTLKIVKTRYNCLAKRYEKFTIGKVKDDYVTSVLNKVATIIKDNDINSSNLLDSAKQEATAQIISAMGGYVVKTTSELFIMDTDSTATAQKVWRWNINGLGYSSTGVSGTYGIAMTADGKIVADFITTGTMSVDRIEGLGSLLITVQDTANSGKTYYVQPTPPYYEGNLWVQGSRDTVTDTGETVEVIRPYNGIDLTIDGESSQVGTPTPTNPVQVSCVGITGSITINSSDGGSNSSDSVLSLSGKMLPSLPNGVKSEINTDDNNHAILTHRVTVKTLNGTENWTDGTNLGNNTRFSLNVATAWIKSLVQTEQYNNLFGTLNTSYALDLESFYTYLNTGNGTTTITAKINNTLLNSYTGATAIDKFKAYLVAHNWYIYYPLLTPETIDLGVMPTITTYDDTTYLTVSGTIKPNLTVEYKKDLPTGETGDAYVCINERLTGSYTPSDWKIADNKVNADRIISSINLTSETAKIKAEHVDLIGYVTIASLSSPGTTEIDGSNITTGDIQSANYVANTTGTKISLTDGTIDTKNFKLSADGSVTATNGSFSGSISAAAITTSSFVGGGLTLNSSGALKYYDSPGFLYCGGNSTEHPYVSALNVATQGSTLGGISFRDSDVRTTAGTEKARIAYSTSNNQLYIQSDNSIYMDSGTNFNIDAAGSVGIDAASTVRIELIKFNGSNILDNNLNGAIYINSRVVLVPNNGGGAGTDLAYINSATTANRIAVSSSGPSSRNVKTNIKVINEQEEIFNEMSQINTYTFDYKYDGIKEDKSDFGFIIDELESLPHISKYVKNYKVNGYIKDNKLIKIYDDSNNKDNLPTIEFKEWDRDSYIKLFFLLLRAEHSKTVQLENKIKVLEESYGK